MPIGQAPPGLGFSERARCEAAWRMDRGWVQQLVPTWAHPTLERCVYAPGADRWRIEEQPAPMVLTAALDGPLVAVALGAGAWAWSTDPVAQGRKHFDPASSTTRAGAGNGAQRRDPLALRTVASGNAATASDLLLGTALAGVALSPLALPKADGRLTNLAVMSEVVALNISVQQLVARRTGEPRPLAFQDLSAWSDPDFAYAADVLSRLETWTSYYSGHTSTVASVAYGYATVLTLSNIDRGRSDAGLALLLYPAAFMVSNVEGQLRVDALKHDPTDVWVGHLAGAAIGSGVPLLHHLVALAARNRVGAPRPAPTGPRLVPMVGPGTVGLQGSW